MMTIDTMLPAGREAADVPALAPHRCAIYFAPRVDSPWWTAGSQWLGRCAQARAERPQPAIAGVEPALLRALTADPRRYGWHATLKAPFQLAPGRTLGDLRAALRALAAEIPSFTLPRLEAQRMDGFLALRPAQPCAGLDALAAACVTRLQPLAAPLSQAEMARRRRAPLTPEQDALLVQWGYPWVLAHFRFHFSLTGDLAGVTEDVQAALLRGARERFDALPPCDAGCLSLFVEPAPGADFVLLEQVDMRA